MTKVKRIPDILKIPEKKRVGIYCRVSTTHAEQISSLARQVSYFTKYVMRMPVLILSDIYIDVKSAETISGRTELQRLLDDCRARRIDLVITKNISRLNRDTVDFLKIIRELRGIGVEIMIEDEGLIATDEDAEFMATISEAFAQAENESRSENTRWGIVKRAKDGTSGLYRRRCYGYFTDENGDLRINENEAAVVRSIFNMYLSGDSIGVISRRLKEQGIKTPTDKDVWSKSAIDKILSNEKYCGNVEIFKTLSTMRVDADGYRVKRRKRNEGQRDKFIIFANHPAIVSQEVFEAVQAEKARRSNIEIVNGEPRRKSTRYSPKSPTESDLPTPTDTP